MVMNCSGLGSKDLLNDEKMYPTRGQLIRVKLLFWNSSQDSYCNQNVCICSEIFSAVLLFLVLSQFSTKLSVVHVVLNTSTKYVNVCKGCIVHGKIRFIDCLFLCQCRSFFFKSLVSFFHLMF